jgi:hypothetical protein
MSDMLEDATLRFSEGNKPYALWRVKSAAQYCVACHTRHKVELDFYDQDPGLSALSVAEQADFYLATRQFERARLLFLDAARAASASYKRLESLRSWLLIAVRVDSDSARAISELTKFRSQVTLSEIEDSELVSWLESLRRWKNESVRLEIDPLTRAKNLIAQGKGLNDPLSGRSGTVELLRATALLHGYLESDGHHVPTERGEGLLLLGEAYQELSISMPGELPEIFFEQCVREFPGSAQAREAFDRYEELVALSFTGSGGVRIPDDVQRGIDELKRLAHGAGGEKQ